LWWHIPELLSSLESTNARLVSIWFCGLNYEIAWGEEGYSQHYHGVTAASFSPFCLLFARSFIFRILKLVFDEAEHLIPD
jgi:hypothetical protein